MKNYNLENESYIVSYLLNNPVSTKESSIKEEYFQDEYLRKIVKNYKIFIENNKRDNLVFETDSAFIDHFLIESSNQGDSLEFTKVQDLKNSFNSFENLDSCVKLLVNDYQKNVVTKKLLSTLITKVSSAGEIKTKELLQELEEIKKNILVEEASIFLTAEQLSINYEKTLEDRENPTKQKSLGFKWIDEGITRPAAEKEITIIAALRGNGKSLFKQTVENNLIAKGVPVVSFSLEMSEQSNMDRYVSSRSNIDMRTLNKNPKFAKTDIRLIRTLEEFRKKKNYLFTDMSDVSFDKLDGAIYKAKDYFRESGVFKNEEEYMFVTIDVLNMITDFGDQEPKTILKCMDKLHNLVKKHRIHVLGIVQINESKLRGGKIYKDPDDLNFYRPNLEDIYGGSGYAQRARVVSILHRPKFLKERMFPDMQEIWDAEPDVLEFHCVKQNDGNLFLKKFIFDGERMRISPYIEADVELSLEE